MLLLLWSTPEDAILPPAWPATRLAGKENLAMEVDGVAPLLQVYDMPRSLSFYRDRVGFEVVATSPPLGEDRFHWVWLRLGGADVMLNTAYEFDEERPALFEAERIVGHRDVCLYLGCPDVDAAYAELRAKQLAVAPPKVASYGMKQLYLEDPDGYMLCFQCPAQ